MFAEDKEMNWGVWLSVCETLLQYRHILVITDEASAHAFEVGSLQLAVDEQPAMLLHIFGKYDESEL